MNPLLSYLGRRLAELDQLLRGEATRPSTLRSDRLEVSARGLTLTSILLAMLYGVCMGSFSLWKESPPDIAASDPYGPYWQILASAVKVPALFALTLLITLPSLYVFNALVGSRLTLLGMSRLLVASVAINVTVLAALGLIVAFFSLTTSSYPFILLLNVGVFTASGVLGLMFLLQTLHRLSVANQQLEIGEPQAAADPPVKQAIGAEEEAAEHAPDGAEEQDASALDMPSGHTLGKHTQVVFRCWIVLFSLVGAQMGWVLRPFIGSPELPFTLFRERESNFFAAVFGALQSLLLGG